MDKDKDRRILISTNVSDELYYDCLELVSKKTVFKSMSALARTGMWIACVRERKGKGAQLVRTPIIERRNGKVIAVDYHKTKKLQVWVERQLYDMCKELVDNGLVYKSMSELVRDGMQMAFDKNSGYMDTLREEVFSKYREDDMAETRCRIDGTLMRLRVSARWLKLEATNNLGALVEDLHDPTLSTEAIGKKYGTRIELYNMHQTLPTDSDYGDAYKQTNAYKIEHGLPIDDDDSI